MKLFYKLNKDLRAINGFTKYELNKVELSNQNIDTRVLQLIINNQILNYNQIENLKKLSENANKMNIKVEVIILK